jgi:hypothetical protein
MKCRLALDAIAPRYRGAIGSGYRTNRGMAFLPADDLASDGNAPLQGGQNAK